MKTKNILLSATLGTISLFASTGMSFDNAGLSKVGGLEDIIKISRTETGNYNVICGNGNVELEVTLDDLMSDYVCGFDFKAVKVIKTSAPRGSGCKLDGEGNPTALSQHLFRNSRTSALITSFKDLTVSSEGTRRKFCAETLQLEIPQGWQVAATYLRIKGEATLPAGSDVRINLRAGFQSSKGKVSNEIKKNSIKTSSDEVYVKEKFDIQEQFATDSNELSWSECGKTFPLEIKTTLQVTGDSASEAKVTVSNETIQDELGQVVNPGQYVGLEWRRCAPETTTNP